MIETSGLALPKPLVQAFHWPAIKSRVTVDGVIAVVDGAALAEGRVANDLAALTRQRSADNALDHDNPVEEVFEDQIACADLVVLNKRDLVPIADAAKRRARIVARRPAPRRQDRQRRRGQGRSRRSVRARHRHRGRYREPPHPSRSRSSNTTTTISIVSSSRSRNRRSCSLAARVAGVAGDLRRPAHERLCRGHRQADAAAGAGGRRARDAIITTGRGARATPRDGRSSSSA